MRNSTSIHYNEVNESMNCKMALIKDIQPGMGGTLFCGSDRYAVVVTHVVSPKHIQVVTIYRPEGKFTTDENGIDWINDQTIKFSSVQDYTLRKNGRWMPKGKGMWETSSIHIGKAEEYIDPDF